MHGFSFKSAALSLHRWIGLILSPLFLLIVISGGILALKPVVEGQSGATEAPAMAAPALTEMLTRADPQGLARQVGISPDGTNIVLSGGDRAGSRGLAPGSGVGLPGKGNATSDFFKLVKSFHKDLLIGAGAVVEFATYAMLIIILFGPLLSWLHLRNTLLGWHLAAGWLVLPLLIMAPLTGVLMSLHIDTGTRPRLAPARPPVSLVQGIEAAAAIPGTEGIISAKRFKAGSVLVEVMTEKGKAVYAVDGSGTATSLRGPGLVKSLHEGIWAGAWSGLLNFAVSIVLLLMTVTGLFSWLRRWRQSGRRSGSADADILIAHASQTGTAARLAEATLHALESGGARAVCASLSGIRPEELKRYRHVLIIASTTGEGELAEPGRAFLQALDGCRKLGAPFALLALGDSRYSHYCAGGEILRTALLKAGASESITMMRADGAPETVWRDWLTSVESQLALTLGEVKSPQGDKPVSLTLLERTRLDKNDTHDTCETWRIVLTPEGEASFRPGDLLMLSPGSEDTERCYSIGSSTVDGQNRIVLTVSLVLWTNGDGIERIGKMSSILCRDLPLGSKLRGAIRHHPHFNPPEDPSTPIIMIATGCGVAPFLGFIEERAKAGTATGQTWLMFGNRYREGDFFYRETFAAWHRQGVLTRLDTTFSRDSNGGGHITRKVIAHGPDIVSLLRDKGGVLYICGRNRLGQGVEEALIEALVGNDKLSEREARETLRRWKTTGSLRQDLFD